MLFSIVPLVLMAISATARPEVRSILEGPGETAAVGNIQGRNANSYIDSCEDIRFYLSGDDMNRKDSASVEPYIASPRLVARCPNAEGQMICAEMALDRCIENIHGELVGAKVGHFSKTCAQCLLFDKGRQLRCRCYSNRDGKEALGGSHIDLTKIISVDNGRLSCWGLISTDETCPDGPSFDPTRGIV